MDNPVDITSLQFDLIFPQGVSLAKNGTRAIFSLSQRSVDHTVSCTVSTARFMAFSMSNSAFTGNKGTVLNVTLDVDAQAYNGTHPIVISNLRVAAPDGTRYLPEDAKTTITITGGVDAPQASGDADGDGIVDARDVQNLADFIVAASSATVIPENVDMNNDGQVTIGDIAILISNLGDQ